MFVKNKTIFINPQYSHIAEFIEGLPSHFDRDGVLIRSERNTVKSFEVDSLAINAKEFCVPPIFYNRFAYCYLRSPKAVKAYTNAVRLHELGIATPTPIAYMLFKNWRGLTKCYFISEQYSFAQSITDYECAELDDVLSYRLVEFGVFTARLHDLGICHGDYGNGNILINYEDEKPIFSLIDINRMRFGEVSMQRGCKEFGRLDFSEEKFSIVAKAYASTRGFDHCEVESAMLEYRAAFKRKRQLKEERLYKIKRIFMGDCP